ncbi:MAG: DsbA family protein [Thiotrichales bacterium]
MPDVAGESPVAPTLWYFADPMCSWCWGFAPVIEAIRRDYADRLRVALILGGLRPGVTEPLAPTLRAEILHHWRDVHARTGQPFRFDGALPEGFVYDTEPASRAVVAVAELAPEQTFAYFKAIQAAFYADGRNVTEVDPLRDLAIDSGVDAQAFQAAFGSDIIRRKTRSHFEVARQRGVRGFPTTILHLNPSVHWLASGYRPYAEIASDLDSYLKAR